MKTEEEKAAHAARMRAWRQTEAGRASHKLSMERWHAAHPEYERTRSKRRYATEEKYRTRIRLHQKKVSATAEGKAAAKKYTRKWLDKHPTYSRDCSNRRYATDERFRMQLRQYDVVRRRRLGIPLTPEQVREVFELTDGSCLYCCAPATTMDHYVPVARGGKHEMPNLVPACRSCNCRKSSLPVEVFFARMGMEYPPWQAEPLSQNNKR